MNKRTLTANCSTMTKIRAHAGAAGFLIVVAMAVYYASITTSPGPLTLGISFVAMFVLGITALARLDDIEIEQSSSRWQVRRAGLIMSVGGAGMLVVSPLANWISGALIHYPTWSETILYCGVALTWITTPHMPPWWRYVTGQYKTVRQAKIAAVASTISGLDEDEDAPQFAQDPPPAFPEIERRQGGDRRESGP